MPNWYKLFYNNKLCFLWRAFATLKGIFNGVVTKTSTSKGVTNQAIVCVEWFLWGGFRNIWLFLPGKG